MDDQLSSLILCQKHIQELFTLNQRLEKKLELQDNKISQIQLLVAQRNEDLQLAIEKYTPLKIFREETTYLRNFLEQKTKAFQNQFDQLQQQQTRQMQILKEENQQHHQTAVEKVSRTTNTVLFQMEQIEKKIHSETVIMVEELTRKSAEMEQNIMKLFQQKQKLLEKLAISQESSNAKINLFENTLNQQLSTISKIQQTAQKQTPNHSVRKLTFDNAEVPIEYLKRQEDALNYMTASIKNIEKKLAETEQKPKLKRELSFDQFQVQWSQQKPNHQQHSSLPASSIKPILIKEEQSSELAQNKSSRSEYEKSSRSELAQNVAEPLTSEMKSPSTQQNRDISKMPLLIKTSPNPITASPIPNFYDDVRMKQEYEKKMQQIKSQEEQQRQSRMKQQQEYERQLQNLKKSQSQLSNDSSMLKNNDSYFFKQEQSLNRNDSQEIIKSSGGLRSLMQKSKERDQQPQTSQSKSNLNLSNQQKKYSQQQSKEQLGPIKNQNVATGGRKSRTSQMRNLAQQQRHHQDQSAEEIVYQLDEDGYLMDENGNYLLDEKGNYIQISDKDLEELKKQNLVIEQE
ncbi:unnamed protein product (macronuclear) [Paramecium tetraurelia]|uniref:Uncharacterized protein n=1 Tax=Paramecium tetraurelia TaxID=5888 RepID=A0EGJ1_PARTE|nr:uncharacterized protein GSPATT00026756001 [Paramecium tetraurelia]CAK94432.1 unnamed protein product [Paramecium tetraurelia]|eukprot:XP_001461805.1 hypothetical protein (macronuclear) [Paramecium tetraurelia strain d4-2]